MIIFEEPVLEKVLLVGHIELTQPLAESVGESATDLVENITLVVVAKCSCNFIVGHVWSVSVLSPESGKSLGIMETKQPLLLVLPVDHVVVLGLL